jgi:PmbA protein
VNVTDLMNLCSEGVRDAKRQGADHAEVSAVWSDGISVDFEKNDLHIASSDSGMTFGVRVVRGDNAGFATSNDKRTLKETIADALVIAQASVPDACNRLPEPRPAKRVTGLYDPMMEDLTVADMTAMGSALLDRVRSRDPRVSVDNGSVACGRTRRAIVSSRGIEAHEDATSIAGTLFGMAVDGAAVGSFVVEGMASRKRSGFEQVLERVGDRFADKALGALQPQKGESYRGAVLFSPEVVESLLVGNMVAMMSSPALRKGKSPLAGKLGSEIAAKAFTLMDDGTRSGEIGSSSFDREGLAHQPIALVQQGVFKNVLYNHYEALRAQNATGSTGHASGGPGALPGVGTTTLFLRPGARPLADIVRDAGRCVLVTRFSGSTNGVTGEFSGVVKAGYLLKDGERRPISETLISGNLLEVFKSIVGLSAETEKIFGHSEMPYVLADGISVTAG